MIFLWWGPPSIDFLNHRHLNLSVCLIGTLARLNASWGKWDYCVSAWRLNALEINGGCISNPRLCTAPSCLPHSVPFQRFSSKTFYYFFCFFFHLLCLTLSPFSHITSPGKGTMNCNNLFEFLFCLNVTHHVQSVTFPKFISRIRSKITLFTERRIEEQRQKQLLRLKKAKMVRRSHQSTIEEDSLTVWQSCKVLELQRHWTIV